jgi:hypothetical protein
MDYCIAPKRRSPLVAIDVKSEVATACAPYSVLIPRISWAAEAKLELDPEAFGMDNACSIASWSFLRSLIQHLHTDVMNRIGCKSGQGRRRKRNDGSACKLWRRVAIKKRTKKGVWPTRKNVWPFRFFLTTES